MAECACGHLHGREEGAGFRRHWPLLGKSRLVSGGRMRTKARYQGSACSPVWLREWRSPVLEESESVRCGSRRHPRGTHPARLTFSCCAGRGFWANPTDAVSAWAALNVRRASSRPTFVSEQAADCTWAQHQFYKWPPSLCVCDFVPEMTFICWWRHVACYFSLHSDIQLLSTEIALKWPKR